MQFTSKAEVLLTVKNKTKQKPPNNKKSQTQTIQFPVLVHCAIILVSCSSSYCKSSIARLGQFPYRISPDSSTQLVDISLQQFLVNTWLCALASSPTKWRQGVGQLAYRVWLSHLQNHTAGRLQPNSLTVSMQLHRPTCLEMHLPSVLTLDVHDGGVMW